MRNAGSRIRRPSPALIIAVIALVASLGGVAVALPGHHSVKADDIAPGAVDPFKTAIMKDGELKSTVTTTSNTPVDLGGPNVTVKVPRGALVGIFAEVNMQVAGGGANSAAQVRLFEPSSVPTSPVIMSSNSKTLDDRFTAPGPNNESGVSGQLRGGWLVFSPGAGRHTFSLRYSGAGNGTALFSDPKLYVAVFN